ncbi:MAG: DedA family protein [Firmicutes bacterium]|nr:DedA family protein [Bacillota bacterium]
MELPEFLIFLQDFCGDLVSKYGAWGVAGAMLLESTGVPFVSTAVLLTAGPMILSGRAGFWVLLSASTAGIIAGSAISYLIGYLGGGVGRAVGHFFNRNSSKNTGAAPASSSRVQQFMEKYGTYSIFVGQLWGVTRTFISFPAGAMQMNLPLFILFTALGGAAFSLWVIVWSLVLTSTAGLLFRLLRVLGGLPPWTWPLPVLAVAVLIYLYRRAGWKPSLGSFFKQHKK